MFKNSEDMRTFTAFVWDYRVLVEYNKAEKSIRILKIGKRENVYGGDSEEDVELKVRNPTPVYHV